MKTKLKWYNYKRWPIYTAYKDIKNYIIFIKTIKKEEKNPNSIYNKFGLKRNKIFNIYFQANLNENDVQLPETMKTMALIEKISPINKYLDETLDFGEYLVPEFNHFLDDKGEPTRTFGIVYYFEFNQISIKWIIKYSILLGLLIYFSKDIIQYISTWI